MPFREDKCNDVILNQVRVTQIILVCMKGTMVMTKKGGEREEIQK